MLSCVMTPRLPSRSSRMVCTGSSDPCPAPRGLVQVGLDETVPPQRALHRATVGIEHDRRVVDAPSGMSRAGWWLTPW